MARTTFAELACPARTAAVENRLRTTVIQALERRRDALALDKDVSLAVLSAADQEELSIRHEEEQVVSSRACPRKKNEFALGRAAVRQALRELGEDCVPVLRGDCGEPLWPKGVLGSITHCWPWSVALVARTARPLAIGIDLESLEEAGRVDISRLICTAKELNWVHHGSSLRDRGAMIFSAKEAVYKGFYPFLRQYIDFKDVELSWLPERHSFCVSFMDGMKIRFPSPRECEVHCRCFHGLVFSCMVYDVAWNTA
jgi:4'-phosphopantetheinyl transferase EntD